MSDSAPLLTIFVNEFVTAGGFGEGAECPDSWRAEGNTLRRAAATDFSSLQGVKVVTTLDARLPAESDPWETVRVAPGDEPKTFARLAAECDATINIAPETGGVLGAREMVIAMVSGQSLGCSAESIALTGDKAKLAKFWASRGVPTPSTRRVERGSALPSDFVYPAVWKPIDGAGSVDTLILDSPESAHPDADGLIQPFAKGLACSASFLVGRDSSVELIGIGRQHVELSGGHLHYEGGTVPFITSASVGELHRAIEGIPGLRGWVGLDFLWNEETGDVTMLEINPRLTSSFVGWQAWFGAPGYLAARWLRSVAGWEIPAPEPDLYEGAVRFTPSGMLSFSADLSQS